MGAKLAHPEKLCMNMWGDAAIGMTGMDFETCVRCEIPIMSILFNNHAMAMEFKAMAVSREKYKSTDISGNYSDWAKALGGVLAAHRPIRRRSFMRWSRVFARRRRVSRCCSSS